MSIWDAFGKGRYKGFSREAGQLLDKAVELAGGLGCKKADTGHLLWAMLNVINMQPAGKREQISCGMRDRRKRQKKPDADSLLQEYAERMIS